MTTRTKLAPARHPKPTWLRLFVLLSIVAAPACDEAARTQPLSDLLAPDPEAKSAAPAKLPRARSPLEDREIRAAIQHALALDHAVPAPRVDVQVEDGIATLVGSIPHLLARRQAVTIAENVRGVRAVVDRMTVVPVVRTDQAIQDDVRSSLVFDPATESYEVKVKVEDGRVELSGRVQSWAESSLAEAVASGVRGVQGVDNQLDIAVAPSRPDREIAHDVRGRLRHDALIDDRGIGVEVASGAVVLSGGVASAGERTRAVARAWVAGVESVDADDLEVEYWARDRFKRPRSEVAGASDSDLVDAVEDALRQDPRVGHFKIQVDVDRGMASLDGWVDNVLARHVAERDARNTAGILGVYNFLRVVPDAEVADHALQARVAALIAQDPYLAHGTVQALVERGNVHLVGNVDNRFERQHAEDLVGRLNGVVHLDSALTVRSAPPPLDAELERSIERSFHWDPFISDLDVDITVSDGIATVRGLVPHERDQRLVLERVYDAGARKVRNQLLLDPESSAPSASRGRDLPNPPSPPSPPSPRDAAQPLHAPA